MSTKLSEPLATYFAGHQTHDVDAMIGPFAEGAIVKDEGHERRGLPAIRKWMEEANAKSSVITIINVAETEASTTVTGRVSGNFPHRAAAWSRCYRHDAAPIQEQARSNRRETKT